MAPKAKAKAKAAAKAAAAPPAAAAANDFRAKMRRIGLRVDELGTHGWMWPSGAYGQPLQHQAEETSAQQTAQALRQHVASRPWVVLRTDTGAPTTALHVPGHFSFDKLVEAREGEGAVMWQAGTFSDAGFRI